MTLRSFALAAASAIALTLPSLAFTPAASASIVTLQQRSVDDAGRGRGSEGRRTARDPRSAGDPGRRGGRSEAGYGRRGGQGDGASGPRGGVRPQPSADPGGRGPGRPDVAPGGRGPQSGPPAGGFRPDTGNRGGRGAETFRPDAPGYRPGRRGPVADVGGRIPRDVVPAVTVQDTDRGYRPGDRRNGSWRGNDGRDQRGYRPAPPRHDVRGSGVRGHGVPVTDHRGYRSGGPSYRDQRPVHRGYRPAPRHSYRPLPARHYVGFRHHPRSWHYSPSYYNRYSRVSFNYYDGFCQANGDGFIAGALLGALLGGAAYDGSGGAILAGSLIGGGIGASLNSCDRGQYYYGANYAFTNNAPYYWHNPHSGVYGVVYARDYYNTGRQRCRWGDAEIYLPNGQVVNDRVLMCLNNYGYWEVARRQ